MMADFQNTIDLLGDTVVARMLVDRTIESFADDVIVATRLRAFYGCKALTSVNIPNVTSIASYSFTHCTTLASVNIPNVTSLGEYAFYGCKALTSVDMPKVVKLASSAFGNCTNLGIIILRTSQVCTLSSTAALSNTPFASNGTGGTVYVPQALIGQYQQATNWSTLYAAGTCNFVAIEGSEYE